MDDTIAAISTSTGVSAIAIIRVSGSKAVDIVSSIFSNKNFKSADTHTIHYGYIIYNEEKIDEVLVTKMLAPKTFTMEDVVEINTHGGVNTTNKVLEILLTLGCRLALPGEFTKRSLLNGRIDYTQAEGIMDLINAKTDAARKMAINQVSGRTSMMIDNLRNEIGLILSNIEVNLNYPEYTDIEVMTIKKIKKTMNDISNKIDKIIKESKNGEILKSGIKTVIIGKPNVGKSSLLNNLIGEEKAIVTDIKGTTRDSVEASVLLDNIILNLIDTAGIRKTDDVVEKIGVNKSKDLIKKADLVLFVVSNNEKLSLDDMEIINYLSSKKYITVINKCDLPKKIDDSNLNNKIYISATENINIDGLKSKIKDLYNLNEIETSDLNYLTSARSIALLNRVKKITIEVFNGINAGYSLDMIEIDLKSIWNLLGEVIGKNYSDELLDTLFSNFCVGK